MKILIATLIMLLNLTTGCVTSAVHTLTAAEEDHIEACAHDNPRMCIQSSLDSVKHRDFGSADFFAMRACKLGLEDGCELRGAIKLHPAYNRPSQNDYRDTGMIDVMRESARQMGTVTATPTPAPIVNTAIEHRCYQEWNYGSGRLETVCN
jgi:hypothetical protein